MGVSTFRVALALGLFFTVWAMPFSANGQEGTLDLAPTEWIRCYTQEYQERLRAEIPGLPDGDTFERWLKSQKALTDRSQMETHISIPVVVHIVHNGEEVGEGLNLSYEQVASQIEVLNEDFRRRPGTPGFNSNPVGADTQIEFCLATLDPDGNLLAEPGVDRVNRVMAGFSAPPFSDEYLMSTVQPNTIWDPESYLNIWVTALGSVDGRGILGLAQLPFIPELQGLNIARAGNTDGVSIHYKAFGRIGDLQEPYTQGRTTTHEVGHYLGLIHVWGDGNCSVDDFCDDTPASNKEVFKCPFFQESCGGQNMVENFMQYTDDVCMNTFTQCQKERMRVVLSKALRRATLGNSDKCQRTQVAPIAEFEVMTTSGCTGAQIQFVDRSRNFPETWSWTFEGGQPGTSNAQNPLVVFPNPGSFRVSLSVSNAQGSDIIEKAGIINVSTQGRDTFFIQDFESAIGDWQVDNPDKDITWEIKETAGNGDGFKAVRVQTYEYGILGARDRLISPVFDLSGRNQVRLNFHHAYRPFSSTDRDSLILYVSTDGGNTFPYTVLKLAESGTGNFATNTPTGDDFVPNSSSDWCGGANGFADCPSVDLSAFDGESQVQVVFEVVNDFGNNIYLDDISLTSNCPNAIVTDIQDVEEPSAFQVFPNPTTGKVEIRLPPFSVEPVELSVMDALGNTVKSAQLMGRKQQITLNISQFPAGNYILRLRTKDRIFFQKVLLYP